MRAYTLARLLLPCIAGLAVCSARADGRKPCGECDCPPPPECVHGPGPKIVVEMSPPEVVFQQAPSAEVACPKPCEKRSIFQHVGHFCRPKPVFVQPAVAPAISPIAVQQAVATSFVPVQSVAVQAAAVP